MVAAGAAEAAEAEAALSTPHCTPQNQPPSILALGSATDAALMPLVRLLAQPKADDAADDVAEDAASATPPPLPLLPPAEGAALYRECVYC